MSTRPRSRSRRRPVGARSIGARRLSGARQRREDASGGGQRGGMRQPLPGLNPATVGEDVARIMAGLEARDRSAGLERFEVMGRRSQESSPPIGARRPRAAPLVPKPPSCPPPQRLMEAEDETIGEVGDDIEEQHDNHNDE